MDSAKEAVEEAKQISQAVSRLETLAVRIRDRSCNLEAKIDPILLPQPAAETGEGQTPRVATAPLASTLWDICDVLVVAASTLENVWDRVEL